MNGWQSLNVGWVKYYSDHKKMAHSLKLPKSSHRSYITKLNILYDELSLNDHQMHVHKCLISKVQHMPTQDINKSPREESSLNNGQCEHLRVWKDTNRLKLSIRDMDSYSKSATKLKWDSKTKTSSFDVMKMNDLMNYEKRFNISVRGIWLGFKNSNTNWPIGLI